MALDLRQNLVSAPYLENKLTESDQILYAQQHWQDLAWDCCPSFFCKILTELRPLIDVRISFPLNILRTNRTKFCVHIKIDTILLGIIARYFSQNFDGVTALD